MIAYPDMTEDEQIEKAYRISDKMMRRALRKKKNTRNNAKRSDNNRHIKKHLREE